MVGCVTVGTKTHTQIVHASFVAYDDRLGSVMTIATEDKIQVTLGHGENAVSTKRNLAGYVPVHHTEMSYFLDLLEKEVNALEHDDPP